MEPTEPTDEGTPSPTPDPSPTPTETGPAPTEAPSPSPTLPPESDTSCGTVTTGESCVVLAPEAVQFFGVVSVLVVLLLAALLTAQMRRP